VSYLFADGCRAVIGKSAQYWYKTDVVPSASSSGVLVFCIDVESSSLVEIYSYHSALVAGHCGLGVESGSDMHRTSFVTRAADKTVLDQHTRRLQPQPCSLCNRYAVMTLMMLHVCDRREMSVNWVRRFQLEIYLYDTDGERKKNPCSLFGKQTNLSSYSLYSLMVRYK